MNLRSVDTAVTLESERLRSTKKSGWSTGWLKREPTSPLPKGEIEEVFTRYEQVCATYPRLDSDMVSCHMDLKPENILFDGQQVWLVDWQAAFVNDRYFDLAVAGNFLLTNDSDEVTYLERYFGQRPNEYQRARFFLMRQVVHMFYATVLLLLGSAGKPIEQSGKLPSFRDFHRWIWTGEVNLADNDLKIVYGRVHWEQLLQKMRQARFEEALRIVSDPPINAQSHCQGTSQGRGWKQTYAHAHHVHRG
jgi:hypothetical protein